MGGGLESRCVGRVYGADGAARHRTHGIEMSTETLFWTDSIQQSVCQPPGFYSTVFFLE